jgi:hypothetical protein
MDELLMSHRDMPDGSHAKVLSDETCDDMTLSTQSSEETIDVDCRSKIMNAKILYFEKLLARHQERANKIRKKSFLRKDHSQQCNRDVVFDCTSPSTGNKPSIKLDHTSYFNEFSDCKSCITAEIKPTDGPCDVQPASNEGNSNHELKRSRRQSESTNNKSNTTMDLNLLDEKSRMATPMKSQPEIVNYDFRGTQKKDISVEDDDPVLGLVSSLLKTWIAQETFTNEKILLDDHLYQKADVDIEPNTRAGTALKNNFDKDSIGEGANREYRICEVDDLSVKIRFPRVEFDSVEIREYERIIGDHPWCSYGPPISIGWRHRFLAKYSLDEYETMVLMSPRRTRQELYLPARRRVDILKTEWQCSEEDIGKAFSRPRKCRNSMRQTKTCKSMHALPKEVEYWRYMRDSGKQAAIAAYQAKLLTNAASKFARPIEPTKRVLAEI